MKQLPELWFWNFKGGLAVISTRRSAIVGRITDMRLSKNKLKFTFSMQWTGDKPVNPDEWERTPNTDYCVDAKDAETSLAEGGIVMVRLNVDDDPGILSLFIKGREPFAYGTFGIPDPPVYGGPYSRSRSTW